MATRRRKSTLDLVQAVVELHPYREHGRWAPPPNSEDDYGGRVAQPMGEPIVAKTPAKFKSAKAFCAEYEPVAYAIEPFVRSSNLYSLTAKTGAGKTALLIVMALALATGRGEILGREVSRGRVAYVAAESPDDLRIARADELSARHRYAGAVCAERARRNEGVADVS